MSDKVIFRMDNVSKKYDNKLVLDEVSYTINKGDIIGYLGPNGAGKTTTIRLMLDLIEDYSGDIHRNTENIRAVLDKEGLYDQLTAFEHINYIYLLYYGKSISYDDMVKILAKVGLNSHKNKKVGTFSKGMKKRLSIACALVRNPDLLILDEPFTGLDPGGQKLVQDLLLDLSKKTSIFLSSHNLPIVSNICTKVIILNKKILYNESVNNKNKNDLEKIYFKLMGDNQNV